MYLFSTIFTSLFSVEFEIEYLEQDELSEIQENDENESITSDDNTNGFRKKAKSERKSYPYRCNLCKKRYVYKEVLEAHLRQHQGLPGYQYTSLLLSL